MKTGTITILILIAIFTGATIRIIEKANEYNVKCLEREFAARLKQQDSTYNVLYERILKGNYKPKKVK